VKEHFQNPSIRACRNSIHPSAPHAH
jgi:hypothetical protein